MKNLTIQTRVLLLALVPVIVLTAFLTSYNLNQAREIDDDAVAGLSTDMEASKYITNSLVKVERGIFRGRRTRDIPLSFVNILNPVFAIEVEIARVILTKIKNMRCAP
mgnify:CR=1 FL=1